MPTRDEEDMLGINYGRLAATVILVRDGAAGAAPGLAAPLGVS